MKTNLHELIHKRVLYLSNKLSTKIKSGCLIKTDINLVSKVLNKMMKRLAKVISLRTPIALRYGEINEWNDSMWIGRFDTFWFIIIWAASVLNVERKVKSLKLMCFKVKFDIKSTKRFKCWHRPDFLIGKNWDAPLGVIISGGTLKFEADMNPGPAYMLTE